MNNLAKYLVGASLAFALVLAFSFSKTNSTETEKKGHRIIFQLTSPDTAAYRALIRQLNNTLDYWPDAQIEVVAHTKGIAMLLKDKTNVQPEIVALKKRGAQFMACENTLKMLKLEKSQVIGESGFVPVGIAEVVTKQEEGWAYIKAGF